MTRSFLIPTACLALLASLGLTVRFTDLAIIVEHPNQTITRLDPEDFSVWLRGYMEGRSN